MRFDFKNCIASYRRCTRPIFVLFLFGILGCNSKSQNNPVIKDGIIAAQKVPGYDTTFLKSKLKKGQVVSFYYSNEYTDTHPPFFISDRDSVEKVVIRYPALLIDSRQQVPFLIYPGENIDVKVENNFPYLSIDGNEERTNELNFFLALNKTKDLLIQRLTFFLGGRLNKMVAIRKFDDVQWNKDASDTYNARMRFLDEYRRQYKISDQFAHYSGTFFKYAYYLQLMAPIHFSKNDSLLLPQTYYNKIDSVVATFACDSCVLNPAYQWATSNLIEYIGRDLPVNKTRFSLLYDTTSNLLTGRSKRFVQFLQLKRNMNIMPENYEQYFDTFNKQANDIYSAYLLGNKTLPDRTSITEKTNVIWDAQNIKITWNELLQNYKGNIVYVDFWASWCVPCRKEIPHSLKLASILKEKNFVVIFISIDDGVSKWKNAMRESGIDYNNSFIIPNWKTSEIIKRFGVNLIPRYLLIGKDGTFISDNAPPPGDKLIAIVKGLESTD